jgi:hypothetical protein
MSAVCTCEELEDELTDAGYTCYHCYAVNKDNPEREGANA